MTLIPKIIPGINDRAGSGTIRPSDDKSEEARRLQEAADEAFNTDVRDRDMLYEILEKKVNSPIVINWSTFTHFIPLFQSKNCTKDHVKQAQVIGPLSQDWQNLIQNRDVYNDIQVVDDNDPSTVLLIIPSGMVRGASIKDTPEATRYIERNYQFRGSDIPSVAEKHAANVLTMAQKAQSDNVDQLRRIGMKKQQTREQLAHFLSLCPGAAKNSKKIEDLLAAQDKAKEAQEMSAILDSDSDDDMELL